MEITPQWVSDVGFPVAAFLMLYRLICAGLDRNTEAIREMTAALGDLRESLAGSQGATSEGPRRRRRAPSRSGGSTRETRPSE